MIKTLEAKTGEALALGVLSKCSQRAEGREASLSRIVLAGQAQPQDEGEVSLPLPVGDPLSSVFPQHGCAPPSLAGEDVIKMRHEPPYETGSVFWEGTRAFMSHCFVMRDGQELLCQEKLPA